MKENRKTSNNVEKLAKKKTIIQVLVIIGIYFIAIFSGLFGFAMAIKQDTDEKLFVIYLKMCIESLPIILISAFVLFIIIYFLIKVSNLSWAYKEVEKQYSKSLTSQKLIKGVPVQVCILKTRNEDYEQFIKSLSDIAEFYATLSKNNLIEISCKFLFDGIDRHFDIVTKEEFTSYYEIMEN